MIDGQTLNLSTQESLGLLGAMIYAGGYLMSAYDRLPSQSPLYYLSKLIAALLVLVSLAQSFNLASAVIQIFFVCVSIIGIFRHLDAQRRSRAYARSRHAPGGAPDEITDVGETIKRSAGYAHFSEEPAPNANRFRATRLYARPDL